MKNVCIVCGILFLVAAFGNTGFLAGQDKSAIQVDEVARERVQKLRTQQLLKSIQVANEKGAGAVDIRTGLLKAENLDVEGLLKRLDSKAIQTRQEKEKLRSAFDKKNVQDKKKSKQDSKKKELSDQEKKELAEKVRLAQEKRKEAMEKQRLKELGVIRAYLLKRDIEPNRDGIRNYLNQITDDSRDWTVAKDLIEKLGSSEYSQRTAAQKELLKLPEVPIELLRQATRSKDREQAFRAKMILQNAIPMRRETVVKAIKFVELAKISGLTKEIFKTVRLFQDEKEVVRVATRTLGAVIEKGDVETFAGAIESKGDQPLKEISIHALRRLEDPALSDRFLKWASGEGSEAFRLEATLALADVGDRRSLGLLVEIMEKAESASIRSRSNVAIRKLTEQNFKFSAYDKIEKRQTKAAEWKKWIASDGKTAKLNFPLHSIRLTNSHLNGHTLLAFGYKNKVVEYDEGMNEIWSYDCQGPWSAEKMSNGNVLIAEYRKNRVIEVSMDKEIVREYPVTGPLNVRPLENGNYLVASYSQRKVLEVDQDGKTVWEFTAKSLVPDAVRMANGNTLVCEYQSVSEVNSKGERVWEVTNKDITGLNQIMGIQALENGNVLLTSMAGYVVEVDRETKKEVWRHNCNRPSDAFRLENGNTLITEANKFIEVDREGKQVWSKAGSNYGSARR